MEISKKTVPFLFLLAILFSCTSNDNNSENCNTVCEYTLASGETAGTAATSIEGTYTLTMDYAATNSPYPDGTKGTFTLMNNTLTVEIDGHECITIKNPKLTVAGSTEIQFRDTCRDQISYDVSMNSAGELNEINISSTDTNTWLGQFNDN